MLDKKPTLEYGAPGLRHSSRRFASVLSIVIGLTVILTSLCCFWAITGYGDVNTAILTRAYDQHWVLFLPPLAIIGIAAGMTSWARSRSTASIFGLVLSAIAFFASVGVSAIDRVLYFMRH